MDNFFYYDDDSSPENKKRKQFRKGNGIIKYMDTETNFFSTSNTIASSFNKRNTLQSSKEIFDTLSDVSTDDSDIQITHVSKNQVTEKNFGSFSIQDKTVEKVVVIDSGKTEKMPNISKKSIDYLTCQPDCRIIQKIDYLNTDFSDILCSSSIASDSSDSDSHSRIVHLDDDLSFVIDGETGVQINSNNQVRIDNPTNVTTVNKKCKKKKSRSKKRFPNNPDLQNDSRMFKYWSQRFDLFERFDMGIKLDKESWYSVTAEYIAKKQAEYCKETDIVLDGFCGAGGNTIQFAYKCTQVVAMDIDPVKIELTKNNCNVYGVNMEKVLIMKENFYSFASHYTTSENESIGITKFPLIDLVFMAPPWGGQNYLINIDKSDKQLSDQNIIDINKLMTTARLFKPKTIMIYLPRNTDESKLQQYVLMNETIEIVKHKSKYKNHIDKKIKAITVVIKCNQ